MKKLVLCLLVGLVLVGVVSAAEFQKVEVNDLSDKNVESIVSSGAGIFKIKMFFDESVNFVDSDVLVQKVSFPGGIESVGDALDPVSVSGSGTMNLVINFEVASVIDGWVKIAFKETEFYIGSLRADYCGPGTGEPDRTFSEEDSVCFMEKYNISSLEADFHGDSFFDLVPNGIINKLDMAGFTEVYQVADAEGKSLDALPEDVELPDLVAEDDMDTCLDALDNWWDQKTDKCYNDFSTMPIYKRCIDPDGGQNIYEYAHTFGFRSYSSAEDPSRDLRIRTGGSDGCLEDGRLLEHYCDENGYIRTTYIDCPNGCGEERGECARGESIKEEIKCIFKNSKEEQECYLAGNFGPEDEGTKFCKGKESCVIDFKGYEGEEITWKSTCGGYQYTKMDGEREKIEFDCGVGKANLTEIKDKGFRFASWECYDGVKSKSTEREACKTSEFWKKFAENFCESHCKKYQDIEKCGVNSFSIGDECYLDLEDFPVVEEVEEEFEETYLVCKNSCPLDEKCYPFGYRKSGEYCSDEGAFVEQLEGESSCDNNFECESNICIDSECVDAGLMRRILNWFKRLFS